MPAAQPVSITLRDIKILQFVYAYDTCSIDHLVRRFFDHGDASGSYGPRVACYRRIGRLREAGYLTTYRLPSLTGVGSGEPTVKEGKPPLRAALSVLSKVFQDSRAVLTT